MGLQENTETMKRHEAPKVLVANKGNADETHTQIQRSNNYRRWSPSYWSVK